MPGWHPDSQASAEQGGPPAECRVGDTEPRTHQGKTRGEPAGSPSHALEEGTTEVHCTSASTLSSSGCALGFMQKPSSQCFQLCRPRGLRHHNPCLLLRERCSHRHHERGCAPVKPLMAGEASRWVSFRLGENYFKWNSCRGHMSRLARAGLPVGNPGLDEGGQSTPCLSSRGKMNALWLR